MFESTDCHIIFLTQINFNYVFPVKSNKNFIINCFAFLNPSDLVLAQDSNIFILRNKQRVLLPKIFDMTYEMILF